MKILLILGQGRSSLSAGRKINLRAERGVALIICMFALLLLSAIGMSLMFMADTETAINYNYRDSQRAYFAAQAGLQEARARMMPGVADLLPAPTVLPSSTGGVLYLLGGNGSTTVAPWDTSNKYTDNEICHEGFSTLSLTDTGANVPCASLPTTTTWYSTTNSDSPGFGTASALSFKWVRVTLKTNASAAGLGSLASPFYVTGSSSTSTSIPICWDGLHQKPLPTGYTSCNMDPPPGNLPYLKAVYRLTSLAVAPAGSRRMAQAEVALDPPFVTNAAVDSLDHVTLNGQLTVDGYDSCSCDCVTVGSGNNATRTCTSKPGKTCDNSRWAIFASGSVDNPNSSENIYSGQSPPIAQDQPWPYDINSLVNKYKSMNNVVNATGPPYNYSCSVCSTCLNGLSCGTHAGQTFGVPPLFPPTDPIISDPTLGTAQSQITYVPGNLQTTGGSTGNGILIVDGDLDIHGGLAFYGLILVKGVIKFTGGGSESTNVYGSVLAGQESLVDNTLGGSASIAFNVCALKNLTVPQPPSIIAFHELTY